MNYRKKKGGKVSMPEEYKEYNDLIKQMKAMPQVTPPSDITQQVMGRLVDEQELSLLYQLKKAGLRFYLGEKNETSISKAACSFYYIMTGFFYLIIGIVSMTGIKKINVELVDINWIGLQPYFAIGIAIWLFSLGVVLKIDGKAGVNAAKYGTMLYIFLAVLNSILLQSYIQIPYAILFVIGLAAASAFMGIMLVKAIQKMDWKAI